MKGFWLATPKREGVFELFPHYTGKRVDIVISVPVGIEHQMRKKLGSSLNRYKYSEGPSK